MSDPDQSQQGIPHSPVSSEGAGTLFVCIPEGRGGTYAFGEDSYQKGNAIAYVDGTCRIGTIFCLTCVGFYFQVSKGRCFVAHLNAWTHEDHPPNAIDPEGGAEIRQQVLEKLLTEYKRREWNFRDEGFAEQIVVCCPAPESQYDGEKKLDQVVRRTGYYICEAIGDFLGSLVEELLEEARLVRLRSSDRLVDESVDKAAELDSKAELLDQRLEHFEVGCYHGFVVEQEDGEAALAKVMELLPEDDLRLSNKAQPADMGEWQPYWLAESMTEYWHFATERDRAWLLAEKSRERKPAEISSIVAEAAHEDRDESDRITQLHQSMQLLHVGSRSSVVRQTLVERPTATVLDLSKNGRRPRSFVEGEPAVHGPSIQVDHHSRTSSPNTQ